MCSEANAGRQEPAETRELHGGAPKDSELCVCWLRAAETRLEGLSYSDVQFDGRTCA